MSILSELKKLTNKSNAKVISEALPPVVPAPTSADSGKFLGVNESGEYALANAGGGSEPFVVNMIYGKDNLTLDKTYAQISEAIADGKRVLFMDVDRYTSYFYLQQYGADTALNSYVVAIMGVFVVNVEVKRFSAESENGVLTNY